MTLEQPQNDHCYTPSELEAFLDELTKELNFNKKTVHGRLVNKTVNDEDMEIDRRYFEFESDKYIFYTYGFTKNPDLKDLPLCLRGKLLRKDFIEHEECFSSRKPEIRKFENEPFFGLGYQTPVDFEHYYEWGQVGCFGDLPSRLKKSQFKGDLVASLKRMDTFDKNAKIKGELVRWNPKSKFGIIQTDLVKKVVIDRRGIPDMVKNPQVGLKVNIRVVRTEEGNFAHEATMG